MKRDECLKILARHHVDQIVVPAYTTAMEWTVIKPSAWNFTFVGAMGQGSSMALGLALGRPDKQVLVLDGDGSLLMNLGSLVTIASVAPKNLIHFVSINGTYEANGGHPLPGRGIASFAGLARAAGYAQVYEFSELADFEARIADVLQAVGPVFVALQVEPGERYPTDYNKLKSAQRIQEFREAIGSN